MIEIGKRTAEQQRSVYARLVACLEVELEKPGRSRDVKDVGVVAVSADRTGNLSREGVKGGNDGNK